MVVMFWTDGTKDNIGFCIMVDIALVLMKNRTMQEENFVWEDICSDYIIHFMFDDLVKNCSRYFKISHFRRFDYELGFRTSLFEVVSDNDVIGMVNIAIKSNNEVHLYYEQLWMILSLMIQFQQHHSLKVRICLFFIVDLISSR